MRVLIVGSGGREHALWEVARCSPIVMETIVAPGNAGILSQYRRAVKTDDIEGLVALAQHECIDFVIVGPEAPLVGGLVDRLQEAGIKAFGPTAQAAQLEGSKIYTKTRCRLWRIPTADFEIADSVASAEYIIKKTGFRVIKYDGLCGGKGVVVADTEDEAIEAAREALSRGSNILIEDRLEGYELSVIVLCDGVNVVFLPIAQDHKRLLDGDQGPNTGGMGAYAPVPVDERLIAEIRDRIILPTVHGMAAQGTPYRGALYAGIMVTKDGPKLIEYNCRFGDPECQVILPLIESDIIPYLYACSEKGGLAIMEPLQVRQECAVCTVLVPQGYPGAHKIGFSIYTYHLKEIDPRVTVFHGGTEEEYSGAVMMGTRMYPVVGLKATGGRTLSVVAIGDTFEAAAQSSREVASIVANRSAAGALFFRKDIAKNMA